MNRKVLIPLIIVVALLLGSAVGVTAGQMLAPARSVELATSPLVPVGSGFSYQGRLTFNNSPATGGYDFLFKLYDALSGGAQVGSTLTTTNQTVTDGLFTVTLDFGSPAFYGEGRWLEIAVRPTGSGTYTTLTPRQALTATPYALSAPWPGISGKPNPYGSLLLPNVRTTVDASANVGEWSSVTIGADGL